MLENCFQVQNNQSLLWASNRRPKALPITCLLGLGVPITLAGVGRMQVMGLQQSAIPHSGQFAFQNWIARYHKPQSRSQPCLLLLLQQLNFVQHSSSLVASEAQTLVLPLCQRPQGSLCPFIIRLNIRNSSSLIKFTRGFQGWILTHARSICWILSYTESQWLGFMDSGSA